jgi:hypothetical protein
MSEINNTNGSEDGFTVDDLRNSAIKECGDWLDRITPCLEELTDERDRLNDAVMVVHESRLTWLERLAGLMDIDVRRGVFGNHMGLYWSDTDGNILRDEESDLPIHEVRTFEDLVKLTTTPDVALRIAKGEEAPEGEAQ